MSGKSVIEMTDIVKTYYLGTPNELEILHGINLSVQEGEFVSIVGPSGSGKSTLMNIIGALDVPSMGEYFLGGEDVSDMTDKELAHIRNKMIGFIFQQYNLLPKLNILENVELPLLYAGVPAAERKERAVRALGRVGLESKQKNLPSQLSGGQQQRVSIARALAGNPSVILADEPTSALDAENRTLLLELLEKQRETAGILFISHDVAALRTLCGTVHVMEHGMLTEQGTIQELLEHPKQAWTKEYAAANHPVSREGWTWTD